MPSRMLVNVASPSTSNAAELPLTILLPDAVLTARYQEGADPGSTCSVPDSARSRPAPRRFPPDAQRKPLPCRRTCSARRPDKRYGDERHGHQRYRPGNRALGGSRVEGGMHGRYGACNVKQHYDYGRHPARPELHYPNALTSRSGFGGRFRDAADGNQHPPAHHQSDARSGCQPPTRLTGGN